MTKFGTQLKTSQIKPWAEHYIDYDKIKALAYDKFNSEQLHKKTKKPRSSLTELLVIQGTAQTMDTSFENALDEESKRINAFFTQSFRSFSTESELLRANHTTNECSSPLASTNRNVVSARHAIIDLYRRFHYLRSYSIVNYTAFVKLLRKHDKLAAEYSATVADIRLQQRALSYPPDVEDDLVSEDFRLSPLKIPEIDALEFRDWGSIDRELVQLEELFARLFCQGNTEIARGELLMTQRSTSKRVYFVLGFKTGAAVMCGLWVMWDCIAIQASSARVIWNEPSYRVYAGLGCVVLFMWLWGFNVFIWNRYRINYLFILELSASAPRAVEIVSSATTMSFLFLTNLLAFNKALIALDTLPPWLHVWHLRLLPLSLLLFMMFRAVYPWSERRSVWRTIAHIVTSPFSPVHFRSFYAADVWTSFVKPSVNIAFGVCYFASGSFMTNHNMCDADQPIMHVVAPLLTALPLWCRFMQCIRRYYDSRQRFPNLANATKYALSHTCVILSVFAPKKGLTRTYHVFWLFSLIVSTLYTFAWDVKMDWSLGSRSLKPDVFKLRSRLMFHRPWVYRFAIFADLVMRFLWTLTLISFSSAAPIELSNVLQPFLASVELIRRTMWGCFRLEAEHLHNTEGFRTIDVIPLHFASQTKDKADNMHKPNNPYRPTGEVIFFCVMIVALGIFSLIAGQLWGT